MSINFNKAIGIWFVSFGDRDFLGAVERHENVAQINYRFREYADDKAWGSKDVKRWVSLEAPYSDEQVAKAIATMRELTGTARSVFGADEVYECLRGDKTDEEFFESFSHMPFIHMRAVSAEEMQAAEAAGVGLNTMMQ